MPGQGLDATLCISYFTIELRGAIPEEQRAGIGAHVFGCDICQDVCPWNGRAPVTGDPAFAPRQFAPRLEELAAISEEEFRAMFRGTPVMRARYSGFLRNVAVAMGNARLREIPRAAGEAGGIGRRGGGGARALGAGPLKTGDRRNVFQFLAGRKQKTFRLSPVF